MNAIPQTSPLFDVLPPEVLLEITADLDFASLIRFSQTCHTAESFAEDWQLTDLWKKRFNLKNADSFQDIKQAVKDTFNDPNYISDSLKKSTLTIDDIDGYLTLKGKIDPKELFDYISSYSYFTQPDFLVVNKLIENVKITNYDASLLSFGVQRLLRLLCDDAQLNQTQKADIGAKIIQLSKKHNINFYYNDITLLIRQKQPPIEIIEAFVENGYGHDKRLIQIIQTNYASNPKMPPLCTKIKRKTLIQTIKEVAKTTLMVLALVAAAAAVAICFIAVFVGSAIVIAATLPEPLAEIVFTISWTAFFILLQVA